MESRLQATPANYFLEDNGIESLQVIHCVKGGEITGVYEIYANS